MGPKRLLPWLRRLPKDECFSIKLLFLSMAGAADTADTPELVHRWKNPNLDLLDDFAKEVTDTAQFDCENRQIHCRHLVQAVDNSGEEISSIVTVSRPSSKGTDPLNLDSTQSFSVMQQMVRFNEGVLRLVLSSVGEIIGGYNQIVSDLREECASLRKREAAAAEMIDATIAEQVGQEINPVMEKVSNLLEQIGPAIVARVGMPHQGPIPRSPKSPDIIDDPFIDSSE